MSELNLDLLHFDADIPKSLFIKLSIPNVEKIKASTIIPDHTKSIETPTRRTMLQSCKSLQDPRMSKILLHIGMPKTATTSFQINICMPLHNQGIINSLEKGARIGVYTPNFYPIASIVRRLYMATRRLPEQAIESMRMQLEALLMSDRLYVISEAGLMTSNYRNSDRWFNLFSLLIGHDVNVLVTLRNPYDFVFSYFVGAHGNVLSFLRK